MSKHTAGPWIAREVRGVGLPGQIGWAIDYNDDQEQVVDYVYEEADARLIAAAPDLLEALMMARDALATALRTAAPDWFETKEDVDAHVGINQIDTAIAKATGEA